MAVSEPTWVLAWFDELVERLDEPPVGDRDRVRAALADVSAEVLDLAGNPDWTAENVPRAVRSVVLKAARRLYTNPDGLTSETETVGGRTTTEQRERTSGGGVYLSAAEVAIVRRHRPNAGGGGLYVQRTTRGAHGDTTVYLPDSYGAEPFPVDVRGSYGQ